jgi:hypothetical protein
MRPLSRLVGGLGLAAPLLVLSGCDDSQSSSEVRRTPEFQEAALKSKDAMIDYMNNQKAAAKGARKAR